MNVVSNRAAYLALTGALDVENDVIKVALHTNLYSADKDNNTWSNTNEVSGVGYTTGGATLANSVVTQNDTGDRAEWDADDVEWPSSTITARYAVVYNTTRANAIICVFDFSTDQSSSNGLFAVRWNATGIMTLAQA
jgi:hypothetical protein